MTGRALATKPVAPAEPAALNNLPLVTGGNANVSPYRPTRRNVKVTKNDISIGQLVRLAGFNSQEVYAVLKVGREYIHVRFRDGVARFRAFQLEPV
jgi:hypothetical protein